MELKSIIIFIMMLLCVISFSSGVSEIYDSLWVQNTSTFVKNITISEGYICDGSSCYLLSEMNSSGAAGSGTVTSVSGDGTYVTGTITASGSHGFNETNLNLTIVSIVTSTNTSQKTYIDAQDSSYNISQKTYVDTQDLNYNISQTSWIDEYFARFTELVTAVGNWSSDSSSYQIWTTTKTYIYSIGNWTEDTGNYYTSTQTDTQITNANNSQKTYIDEQNVLYNDSITTYTHLSNFTNDGVFITGSEVVPLVGNWTSDSSSYQIWTSTKTYVDSIGNWTNDKSDYFTSAEVNALNDSWDYTVDTNTQLSGVEVTAYVGNWTLDSSDYYTSAEVLALNSSWDYTVDTDTQLSGAEIENLVGNWTDDKSDYYTSTEVLALNSSWDYTVDTDTQLSGSEVETLVGNWSADKSSYWDTSDDIDTVIDSNEIAEAKISFSTACAAGNHYYLNGNDLACEADAGTIYTAGNGVVITGTEINASAETCGAGDFTTWNGTAFNCDAPSGSGDITGVSTNDKYLSGGSASSAVNLTLVESELNTTILALDTDTQLSGTEVESLVGNWSTDKSDYFTSAEINSLNDSWDYTTDTDTHISGAEVENLVGNWSSDSSTYQIWTTTKEYIDTLGNWSAVSSLYKVWTETKEYIDTLGNWSEDKSDYYTSAQVLALNGSWEDTDTQLSGAEVVSFVGNWTSDSSSYQGWTETKDYIDSIGNWTNDKSDYYTSAEVLALNGTWADTDTTYSAGNGISLSTTTFSVAGNTALTQDADGLSVTADGIGDTQLEYNTGQHLTTTSDVAFSTLNVSGVTILNGYTYFDQHVSLFSNRNLVFYDSGYSSQATIHFDDTDLVYDAEETSDDKHRFKGSVIMEDDLTVTTVDTGQGANELYDMDQPVLTTSDVTFNNATLACVIFDNGGKIGNCG